MNCLSLNLCGTGSYKKRSWVRSICESQCVVFLGIQETRMTQVDFSKIRSMWGNQRFDFAVSCARGRSGGILSVWDPRFFARVRILSCDNYLVVYGTWLSLGINGYMVNVYAPQSGSDKRQVWNSILSFINQNPGEYVLFGDFNVVRNQDERFGSVFCQLEANDFNDFIADAGLVDTPFTGRRFMRISSDGGKMARLDRFLVSEAFLDYGPTTFRLFSSALDRKLSDHTLILLSNGSLDYGPTTFRLFNSWLDDPEFEIIVQSSWAAEVRLDGSCPFMFFKNALKNLKSALKLWQAGVREKRQKDKSEVVNRAQEIDVLIDGGMANPVLMQERREVLKKLSDLEAVESIDVMQKMRLKWGVEGDENSKFFCEN